MKDKWTNQLVNVSLVAEDEMQAALLVFYFSFRTWAGQKLVDGSVRCSGIAEEDHKDCYCYSLLILTEY